MTKQDWQSSPPVVFILYIAVAFAGICGYRYVFPEPVMLIDVLDCFKVSWRFTGGIVTFINLYPALAFSALVIPFGLKEHSEGGYAGTAYLGKKGFSVLFLKYLSMPVMTAFAAGIIYSVLFFLALPMTINVRTSILDRSELYAQARANAGIKGENNEWSEALQFIAICEAIWPGNEKLDAFKIDLIDSMTRENQSQTAREIRPPDETDPIWAGIPGNPVDSIDALRQAEEAFNEERYYDAHWLATLAQRLASPGAAEISSAVTLASRAWEQIASLEPNALETESHRLYLMKRSAYEAMNSGDWISAFYIFKELSALTPDDPDVAQYLQTSSDGVTKIAFFIDELDMAVGYTLTWPVFSLPDQDNGRMVLRFASLALFKDHSYAWEPEIIAVNDGSFRYRVNADYAKLIPISAGDGEGNLTDRMVLLFRALDRDDKTQSHEPVWTTENNTEPDAAIGASQIMLNIGYDDFLLLSKLKRGINALHLGELFTAEKTLAPYGYIREGFRTEILRRLGDAVFFLPMAILVLILGWRYRAQKKPRYVYVPMLVLLPMVFYWFLLFYRNVIGDISVWLSLNMGFTLALISLSACAGILLIVSLVLLAAQHG